MGRPKFFRQRILTQAASLEAKGLFNYLVSEIRVRREVSLEEAVLIAQDVHNYMEKQLLNRAMGQIEFPAVAGRNNHKKRSRDHQSERIINLTVVAEEDIELMAEFGIAVMQKGRLARVIEETYHQNAILDGQRLLVLIPRTLRATRSHLKDLWHKGALLPVAGMNTENRKLMQNLRSVLAVERYLKGEDLTQIRRDLAISQSRWHRLWHDFKELARNSEKAADELKGQLIQPQEVLTSWQEIWAQYRNNTQLKTKLGIDRKEPQPENSQLNHQTFYQLLQRRHGYSPAAAEQFMDDLQDIAARLNRQERGGGQIVYNAVASHEPAGRKLTECELKGVVLDYVAPEDWELAERDSAKKLKWARLERLVTQARAQGATLTQPDLALLLGISSQSVGSILKAHPNVILPTRGIVADMGPALSHADKIIRLYMDGYTETEIVRRTGHSYDSIENYLLDFARVTYLLEKHLPIPAIRKVMGCSRKLVEKYVSLYREFSGPDYAFMMARIRRMAEAHPVKKN